MGVAQAGGLVSTWEVTLDWRSLAGPPILLSSTQVGLALGGRRGSGQCPSPAANRTRILCACSFLLSSLAQICTPEQMEVLCEQSFPDLAANIFTWKTF